MSRPTPTRALVALVTLAAAGGFISVARASAATAGPGVVICHHAGPTKLMTMKVGESAVQWHVESHGDTVGACGTGGGGGDPT